MRGWRKLCECAPKCLKASIWVPTFGEWVNAGPKAVFRTAAGRRHQVVGLRDDLTKASYFEGVLYRVLLDSTQGKYWEESAGINRRGGADERAVR